MHENTFQSVGNWWLQPAYDVSKGLSSLTSLPVNLPNESEVRPLKCTDQLSEVPKCSFASNVATHALPQTIQRVSPRMKSEGHSPTRLSGATRYTPYTTSHFLSYRQKIRQANTDDLEPEKLPFNGCEVRQVTPHKSDSSMPSLDTSPVSSSGSIDMSSGSERSSPESAPEQPVTSPETSSEQINKKKARINYTNEQIQTLLKLFYENPYPESETMENLANDFGVPENKIKIWFQNKRARWRRRVNNNMNNFPGQPFMPVSPMLSSVPSYASMYGNMISPSPQHLTYFNYPWMQTSALSPNNNNQQLQGHHRLSPSYLTPNSLSTPYLSTVPMTSSISSLSSAFTKPIMTGPQHTTTAQDYRHHQYNLPTYSTGGALQSLPYTLQ